MRESQTPARTVADARGQSNEPSRRDSLHSTRFRYGLLKRGFQSRSIESTGSRPVTATAASPSPPKARPHSVSRTGEGLTGLELPAQADSAPCFRLLEIGLGGFSGSITIAVKEGFPCPRGTLESARERPPPWTLDAQSSFADTVNKGFAWAPIGIRAVRGGTSADRFQQEPELRLLRRVGNHTRSHVQ